MRPLFMHSLIQFKAKYNNGILIFKNKLTVKFNQMLIYIK
jgi:hypothetical protein